MHRNGSVDRRYDLRAVHLRAVTGLAIAPSADRSDHPTAKSLYVADAGSGTTPGRVVEVALASAFVPEGLAVSGSLVRTVATSTFSPPSPDPSGIGYLPDLDRFVISDGEVEEMSIFAGVNLFETTRAGVQTRNGVSQPWSNEPTGVGYNSATHHLLVSDDSKRDVFDVAAGPDTRYGSSDDVVTSFDTLGAGNDDPEDVTWDPVTGSVWTIDGLNTQVFRYRPGPDGRFGTADDLRSNFDVGSYGAGDPEGIAYDSARDTLVVLDDLSAKIYELDRSGALLNTVSTTAANTRAAAGIAIAPGSASPADRNYFIVDRGVDNDNHPDENDGKLYELAATLPPVGVGTNQPPAVSAGADQTVTLPASASLDGDVADDGRPNPPGATTVTWSKVSGFGDVVFANANAVDTTASFSADGTYVLRLSASDGQSTVVDDVIVTVRPAGGGGVTTVEAFVLTGSDDAEQGPSGGMDLVSTDLELVTDGIQGPTRRPPLRQPPGPRRRDDQPGLDPVPDRRGQHRHRRPHPARRGRGQHPDLRGHQQQREQPARHVGVGGLEPARLAHRQRADDRAADARHLLARPGSGRAGPDGPRATRWASSSPAPDDVRPSRSRATSPRSSTSSTAPARPRATPPPS